MRANAFFRSVRILTKSQYSHLRLQRMLSEYFKPQIPSQKNNMLIRFSMEDDAPDFPYKRQLDHTIRLPRLDTNLPNVSFCNTGDDPGGRYLLATDIEGSLHFFDVRYFSYGSTHASALRRDMTCRWLVDSHRSLKPILNAHYANACATRVGACLRADSHCAPRLLRCFRKPMPLRWAEPIL